MAKTTNTAPIASGPKAPPRSFKGEPPKSASDTPANTSYTKKPATGKTGLNTMVPTEFHVDLKVWAATHGMTMAEALQKGFELLKEKHR